MMTLFLTLMALLGACLPLVAVVSIMRDHHQSIPRQRRRKGIPDYDYIRELEHDLYPDVAAAWHIGEYSCHACNTEAKQRRDLSPKGREKAQRLVKYNLGLDTIEIQRPRDVPKEAKAAFHRGDLGGMSGIFYSWYDVKTGQQVKYFQPIVGESLSIYSDQQLEPIKRVSISTGFG